jgi:cytochrome P450
MGRRIPKGARIIISPYVAHRLPDIWEQPEEFAPDRFTPVAAQERSPYAYIPFGAGSRQCIGRRFALIETQLVLANLIRRFAVAPVDSAPVPPVAQATLRPARPIRLKASPLGSQVR